MKKLQFAQVVFFLSLLALLDSCMSSTMSDSADGVTDDPTDGSTDGTTPVSLVDSLFVKTDPTTTVFETNDQKYWSTHGYTLWTLGAGQGVMVPFTSREVSVAKQSGNTSSGFGMVICQGSRTGYGDTMLTIMINLNKRYTVGKVIGGTYSSIIPWTECSYLSNGYGVQNKLKVSYDGATGKFTVMINGANVQTFESIDPVQIEGKSGYLVVISPEDSFPTDTVKVVFSE